MPGAPTFPRSLASRPGTPSGRRRPPARNSGDPWRRNSLRLVVFGHGYSGAALARRLKPQGWDVVGTVREAAGFATLEAQGVAAILADDRPALVKALSGAQAVLV